MRVSSDMPDDVLVLHDALQQLQEYQRPTTSDQQLILHLKNCGTALRFLQVHIEKCYPNEPIILDGDPRLKERDGKPTSQTTSALILHGVDIPVTPDESPYITMTRKVMEKYNNNSLSCGEGWGEVCWSSAAFWYEYIAIHGGELLLEGLTADSIQGDRVVADIYAEHFGVQTEFVPEGAVISTKGQSTMYKGKAVSIDFSNCPDLYPAVALTCEKLGMELHATGTERLRYKESDRLEAVRLHEVRNDHRIAMALMCADYEVAEAEQTCICKSYPRFTQELMQLRSKAGPKPVHLREISHITPVRGVNDEGKGKKYALSKLIHAASSEYVWLHDDDVVWPHAARLDTLPCGEGMGEVYDLIILPLRMESALSHEGRGGEGLLERLQIAEYAAIQELTMRMAKKEQAVMCSGANLIVRREAWLACEPDIHPEIPSGDDMFLLEAAKRRGFKIGVIDEPDFTAVVRPQTSWRAFFRQRMRWAGKAPHYTDKDIIHCGRVIATLNILQFLCPLIILFKFPAEYGLICRRELTYPSSAPRTSWHVALLLEILYPYYLLICLIGGLFRKGDW